MMRSARGRDMGPLISPPVGTVAQGVSDSSTFPMSSVVSQRTGSDMVWVCDSTLPLESSNDSETLWLTPPAMSGVVPDSAVQVKTALMLSTVMSTSAAPACAQETGDPFAVMVHDACTAPGPHAGNTKSAAGSVVVPQLWIASE